MKRRWTCVVASALLAFAALVQAQPVEEEDRVQNEVTAALWFGDLAELERLHALYQQPGQLTVAGRSKLVLFNDGVGKVFNGPKGQSEAFFVQMEALTLHWAQSHPESALVHALHAEALIAHAWSYRGDGYANTVTPQAWRDFKSHIERALAYLARHGDVALRSSSGYVQLLHAGRAAGWDADRLWSVAQAGLQRNPEDERLYRAMLTALLPKWGGSAVQVDRLIQDIAKRTAATHGDIYYARMYAWASDWQFSHQLFEDSGASWPRIKSGYQELVRRHPAPINVNGYAHMACLARDKPVLLDLLEQIGRNPVLAVWGSNPSRIFEGCKRWAAQQ